MRHYSLALLYLSSTLYDLGFRPPDQYCRDIDVDVYTILYTISFTCIYIDKFGERLRLQHLLRFSLYFGHRRPITLYRRKKGEQHGGSTGAGAEGLPVQACAAWCVILDVEESVCGGV